MVCKIKGSYYPQIFLEQCKHREKEGKLVNFYDEEIQGYVDEDNEGFPWILL